MQMLVSVGECMKTYKVRRLWFIVLAWEPVDLHHVARNEVTDMLATRANEAADEVAVRVRDDQALRDPMARP